MSSTFVFALYFRVALLVLLWMGGFAHAEAPPDSDGDGIADTSDGCPSEPGVMNGCPCYGSFGVDADCDSIPDIYDDDIDIGDGYDGGDDGDGEGSGTEPACGGFGDCGEADGDDPGATDNGGSGSESGSPASTSNGSDSEESPRVIDGNLEAISHYYGGDGEEVKLGPKAQAAIRNSDRQLQAEHNLRTGETANQWSGLYGVDGGGFIGKTPVSYTTSCAGGRCTTTFVASDGDGFWDLNNSIPQRLHDRDGPVAEYRFGNPYAFIPFSWSITYDDPRPEP